MICWFFQFLIGNLQIVGEDLLLLFFSSVLHIHTIIVNNCHERQTTSTLSPSRWKGYHRYNLYTEKSERIMLQHTFTLKLL